MKALELLEILNQYRDLDLAPIRYVSSTVRTFQIQSYTEADLGALWTRVGGGVFKTGKKWNCVFHVFFFKPPKGGGMSSLWIHIDEEYFRDQERSSRFVDLCKALYSWGKMDHGYVALEDEYRTKNVLGEGGVGGPNLKVAIPGVYWANFFGPVYVKWLGEERFRTLDGFATERLSDGGWLVFARQVLFEYESRSVKRQEKRLMRHLGREAFFERQRPFKRAKTPDFGDH